MSRGIRNGDLVLVKWLDASGSSSWIDREDFETMPVVQCETTGVLINRSGKVVRVAGTTNNIGRLTDTTVIPDTWVLEITRLIEAE